MREIPVTAKSTAYTTKMETRFSNLRTQFKKITLGVGHVYVIKAMQPATIFTHVIFRCNVKNTFLLHKAYAARHVRVIKETLSTATVKNGSSGKEAFVLNAPATLKRPNATEQYVQSTVKILSKNQENAVQLATPALFQ